MERQRINHPVVNEDYAPEVAELIEAAWRHFEAFLRNESARITQTRRAVLAHAVSHTDHFSADQLAAELKLGRNRVSRGTVYRTLALMVEAGILRPCRESGLHTEYECVFGAEPHEHLLCDSCRKWIEFSPDAITSALEDICREHGFTRKSQRVVIVGTCAACNGGK